jgi:hypothetical protein
MPTAIGSFVLALLAATPLPGDDDLPAGVRGLVVRANEPISVDGRLTELAWSSAYCTPLHFNHRDLLNRAAQVYYLWDEKALYIGLRALDQKRSNVGDDGSLWNGDSVEFYLDTRAGDALRGKDWSAGAVHLFYTPFTQATLRPRWAMRQGIATSDTKLDGVALAASEQGWGYEAEFAIPWANFDEFRARAGSLIGLDFELCSGDGGPRVDRTFAFGSPLSVQQPASLGLLALVDQIEPEHIHKYAAAMTPLWVETPWVQADRARVQAVVGLPPAALHHVGSVEVRLHDTDGTIVRTVPAELERFGPLDLGFVRALATWPIDDFAPGTYFATARVVGRDGETLTTVAPRLVHEASMTGR